MRRSPRWPTSSAAPWPRTQGKAQARAVLDVTLGVLYSKANKDKKLGLNVASDWDDMLNLMKKYNGLQTDKPATRVLHQRLPSVKRSAKGSHAPAPRGGLVERTRMAWRHIELRLTKIFATVGRRGPCLRTRRPGDRAGGVRVAARAVGMRQVDPHADDCRAARADRPGRSRSMAATGRRPADRHRHHVPGQHAGAVALGARQHRAAARAARRSTCSAMPNGSPA